jgi:hypothetical protein
VSVIDRAGKRLKIPAWMLSPEAGSIAISERIHLSKEALLSLASLLSLHAGENRGLCRIFMAKWQAVPNYHAVRK